VTLWAGELMALSALLEAIAPSFGVLLLARLVFGAGYGVTWTAGLSWLAEGSPGSSSIGGSVASAGVGGVIGPVLFGFLSEYLGLSIPFLAAATAVALLTAALGRCRPLPQAPARSEPLSERLHVAASDCLTVSATASIVVAGVTSGITYLLVPGELHAAGSSSGMIGLAFSVAGMVFVAGSVVTAWLGRRAVRLAVCFAGMVVLAGVVSPAVLSAAPLAILTMLLATAGARSVVWTIAYPLGAAGAARSGAGIGLVMGLMNGVWAATAVLSPLVAGVVAERFSPQAAFGVAELACGLVVASAAFFVLRGSHRGSFSVTPCSSRWPLSSAVAKPRSGPRRHAR
jgi:predicted MFS family arabinose efflux permease